MVTTDAKSIAEKLEEIFTDCLFKDGEIPDGMVPSGTVIVEGLTTKFGFHPTRLGSHKEEIREILNQMDDAFHKSGGGGMSFLNLCNDRNGHQWTGLHRTMEKLVVLAMAAGMGSYCAPRDLWSILPGGMPYIVFDTEA